MYQIWFDRSRYNYIDYEIGHGNVEVGFSCIIKQGDDYLCHTFRAFRHKQDSTLVAEQTAISSIFAFFVSIYSVFVERPG